jgi:hypothetical protein
MSIWIEVDRMFAMRWVWSTIVPADPDAEFASASSKKALFLG